MPGWCVRKGGIEGATLIFFLITNTILTPDRPSLTRPKNSSYLVDPASSHMLVSKIKPCMSKYKQLCTVKLRMAH